MGVAAMDKAMRGGDLVASFPVELDDQIMLATSKGQSIRVPVDGISFRSRSAGACGSLQRDLVRKLCLSRESRIKGIKAMKTKASLTQTDRP